MRKAVVTGGAGFIGTNLASRLVEDGHQVVVLDTLGRPGSERNLHHLRETYGSAIRFEHGDVRDAAVVRRAVRGADRVFHLAGQVAVTSSLDEPLVDLDVNIRGTLTVLEELRRLDEPPFLLFTSTNKVYGALLDLPLELVGRRWLPVDDAVRAHGLSEERGLDFCTPYGCSKGAADQYVLDYAKSYGLPTTVFRMSCIYGPHQNGTEDQGWVAHLAIRALRGEPITVYGDGLQVRDLLFVDDLVEAMQLAHDHRDRVSGRAFNIGGGPANAVSVSEVLELVGASQVELSAARIGDQRYYVADTRRFREATGWSPLVEASEGIERLVDWLAPVEAAA